MARKLYSIEYYADTPLNKWFALFPFQHMSKSFAEGAWAMLKSHYNQKRKHRLLRDGQVVDQCGLQTVHLN